MKAILTIISVCMITISLSQSVPAQNPGMAVQITEAHKANAALMQQYTWHSRTELIVNGEVKDNRLELCDYGPDGQIQRSLVNDQGASLPRGFLRRAVAEKEKAEIEQYLTGLRGLVDQYTLPTAGKVLDFMNHATTAGPDSNGLFHMTGQNVVVVGDTLSIATDAATRKTRGMQISTFFQGDPVELTSTFKTLISGLTYVAYAEVTIPTKAMSVQVQNFDYNRTMQTPAPQVTGQQLPTPTVVAPSPPAAAPSPPGTPSLQTIEQKLKDLKALFDQGLISQNDYDAKKAQILQGL